MTDKQPEALRLADAPDQYREWSLEDVSRICALLRTQLEAMVGEPVYLVWLKAHCTWMHTDKEGFDKTDPEYRWMLYTAAPVAQQYEAGDMASAAAQGFRDGVASVTQPQEPVAWAMPKGDGTFIDVITPAEHARDEGSYTVPLFAHPVAQQPQAEPDIHEAQGQIEFLDKKNNALSAAIRKVMARLADLLDEDQFKEIEEIVSFAGVQPQAEAVRWGVDWGTHGDRTCVSIIKKHADGKMEVVATEYEPERKAAPQQAEAVPTIYVSRGQLENLKPDPEDEAGTYLPVRKTPKGKFTHPLFAAPQQAEAVPSECDVRKIMVGSVPGPDGMGHEVYAKSVDDVVNLLTKMGERIEDLEGEKKAEAVPSDVVRAVAAEREACARQCEDIYSWRGAYSAGLMCKPTLKAAAAAIRARGHAAIAQQKGAIHE